MLLAATWKDMTAYEEVQQLEEALNGSLTLESILQGVSILLIQIVSGEHQSMYLTLCIKTMQNLHFTLFTQCMLSQFMALLIRIN